jgi:hypothetical protein
MSPDLARALHDAVESGPSDVPFSVDTLTGRIRRRRTVRAGVRGGVAVGAAGAVAIGAVYVGGHRPASVLPAARADAAPGTCGSDITALAPTTDPGIGFVPITPGADVVLAPQPSGPLGTFVGRHFDLGVALPATADDHVAMTGDDMARSQLATLTAQLAEADDDGPDVEALRAQVAELRGQLDPVAPDARDLQVLVTSGTTVVAISAPDQDTSWSALVGPVAVRHTMLDLETCASPGAPGGVPLPAGAYSSYVTYRDPGTDRVTAVGPATLDLVDPTLVRGLPAGFPTGFSLLGERLVSATQDTPSGRWVVVVEQDGDDRVTAASSMLGLGTTESWTLGVGEPPAQSALSGRLDGWSVRVAPSTTEDGAPSIVYLLTPTD